jgi:hypothetical protein
LESYVHGSKNEAGERIRIEITEQTKDGLKVAVLVFTSYMAMREVIQAWVMHQHPQLGVYAGDSKNAIDVLVCAGLVYCTTADWRHNASGSISPLDESTSVVTGFVSLLLSMKLLLFLKGLNVQYAKFVLCIPIILRNMLPFLVIMGLLMLGFAHAFHSIDRDDDPENYGTFGLSIFSVYLMMLREFPDEGFPRPVTSFLFMLFTLLVMIVVLNVLIAVVSDGYDGAALKAKYLFFLGRIELVAELELLFRRRAQAEDAEKCLDKMFKFIAGLAQQLGVVYWLLGVHEFAIT